MISCVAIDDESLALSVIEDYIRKSDFLELKASFTNPVKAFTFVNENDIDLIFIDIQMPDLNGMELVSKLRNKPLIIFTTAYSKYAIDGFKVDAIDYLLKPIDFPDFAKAADKAREWFYLRSQKPADIDSNNDFLFIKSEHKVIRINFKDILYIQGMSEYVKIFVGTGKPITSLLSLKSLEQRLPQKQFMRVHKSYIISLPKISMIENGFIVLNNGHRVSIGLNYKEGFMSKMKFRML